MICQTKQDSDAWRRSLDTKCSNMHCNSTQILWQQKSIDSYCWWRRSWQSKSCVQIENQAHQIICLAESSSNEVLVYRLTSICAAAYIWLNLFQASKHWNLLFFQQSVCIDSTLISHHWQLPWREVLEPFVLEKDELEEGERTVVSLAILVWKSESKTERQRQTEREREKERELHPCMRERDGRRDATVVAARIRREGW